MQVDTPMMPPGGVIESQQCSTICPRLWKLNQPILHVKINLQIMFSLWNNCIMSSVTREKLYKIIESTQWHHLSDHILGFKATKFEQKVCVANWGHWVWKTGHSLGREGLTKDVIALQPQCNKSLKCPSNVQHTSFFGLTLVTLTCKARSQVSTIDCMVSTHWPYWQEVWLTRLEYLIIVIIFWS